MTENTKACAELNHTASTLNLPMQMMMIKYYLHKPVMDWMGPCLQDCECARYQQQEILTRLHEVMSGANMNTGKTKINTLERPGRRELSIKQVGSSLNPEIELKSRIN